MNKTCKGWLLAWATTVAASAALAAAPSHAPLETQIIVPAKSVISALSNDRNLAIGSCADCERLELSLVSATSYSVNGTASSWGEVRNFLRANPDATLQIAYQVKERSATRVAVTGPTSGRN